MKALLLLCAAVLILLGLTGVFWPEGLMDLAKYSFTTSGTYAIGALRILVGAFLFLCAKASRTPRTIRVIGAVIFTVGIVGVLLSHEPAQRMSEWLLAKGSDTLRIVACLPLAVGFFIAGSTLTKSSRN
ncbi:MAG: hypothetical protein QOG27_806 [Verrucomicrobiota bacterium]|jgi:hypothetical protein